MKISAIILSIVLFISCVSAACVGTATIVPRTASGSSWTDGINNFQIYDVALANTGSCPLDQIIWKFTFSAGASLNETWNMLLENGLWVVNASTLHVSNGSPLLAVGVSLPASVGFTLRFPKSSASATASLQLTSTKCASCGPSSAPSGAPSTSGIATSSPSSAPTSAPGTGSCSAVASVQPRAAATWNDGSFNYQIYDLVVTNVGSCALNSVGLQFAFSAGASINSSWNLLSEDLYYLLGTSSLGITSGNWLGASQTSMNAAGFILKFPLNSNSTASVTVYGAACDASCSTSSSPSSAPTSAPTSAPSGPSSAPSSAPTSAAGSCKASAFITLDASTPSWVDAQGQTDAIYRLTVRNTGACPMSSLTLSFSPLNVVSSWNLQSVVGGYALQNFGPSIASGQSNTGAGFVLADVAGPLSVLSATPTCLPC